MAPMWVNGKFLSSENKKSAKWKPAAAKEKVLWSLCGCGEVIYDGDTVGMIGDHLQVICFTCWSSGDYPAYHCDCAGLKLPEATLSN